MIYATNRTISLGESVVTVETNKDYLGAGAYGFAQECAQDELALFEAGIKSDIDEVMIGESASELTALNESFVENVVSKIKEMMKKFMEWLDAIMRSAVAKITNLLRRDNASFAKSARKQFAKMKSLDVKFKATTLKSFDLDQLAGKDTEMEKELEKLAKLAREHANGEGVITALEAGKEVFAKLNVSEFMEKIVEKDVEITGVTEVEKYVNLLEGLDKKSVKDLEDNIKSARDEAKKISDAADKLKKGAETAEAKTAANTAAKAASLYKACVEKYVHFRLSVLAKAIKVARAVVVRALGAKIEESAFDSEEMMQAMIEAAEYEYDEALEEMSETEVCDVEDDDEDEEE